jgi:hypothetical protein
MPFIVNEIVITILGFLIVLLFWMVLSLLILILEWMFVFKIPYPFRYIIIYSLIPGDEDLFL